MPPLKCTGCHSIYVLCIQSVEQFFVNIGGFFVQTENAYLLQSNILGIHHIFHSLGNFLFLSCHRTKDYPVCNAVEGHCLQAKRTVHYHTNGHRD